MVIRALQPADFDALYAIYSDLEVVANNRFYLTSLAIVLKPCLKMISTILSVVLMMVKYWVIWLSSDQISQGSDMLCLLESRCLNAVGGKV